MQGKDLLIDRSQVEGKHDANALAIRDGENTLPGALVKQPSHH